MSGTYRTMTGEDITTAVLGGAITMEEIARKRRSVQIGDKIILRQQAPLRDENRCIYVKERCTVIAKYPAFVIFQRPSCRNGHQRTCTRLWVELCMADRGQAI